MKYKLKRDLPFAKAGKEVKVNPTGCIPFINYSSGEFATTEEYVDKLLSEGWIEEVKPREWWEIERTDVGFYYDDRFGSYEEAEGIRNSHYKNSRIIKVREVIE